MSELCFREATMADAEQLAAVYRSAFRENRRLGIPHVAESASESHVADWIRRSRMYVAESGGDVIAGVRLEDTAAERVKLSRLAVCERWKRRGVGSRLMDYVEEQIRDSGYSTIWLTTPESHPYLLDVYRRRGYEQTGTHPGDRHADEFVVLEKDLRR